MDAKNLAPQGVTENERYSESPAQQVKGLLHNDAALQGLEELIEKLEPLLAGGRLNRIVDLVSVTADLVDMTDAYMIEKLAKAYEDAIGAAWTTGNAARMAHQQVSDMEETPNLMGLLRIMREPDVRRGLAFMLSMAGVLGKGMVYDDIDYTQD